MKLIYSRLSPYARKVLVLAHELNIVDQLELVAATVTPMTHDSIANLHNPLGKVPTLVLDDGQVILDSRVICEYLLDTHGSPGRSLTGHELWRTRTRAAVAEGMTDAAMIARYEVALRPQAVQWSDWIEAYEKKIVQALDFFERSPCDEGTSAPSIADIGMACALGYLDYRFAHLKWREGRPELAKVYEALAQRPSLVATHPS